MKVSLRITGVTINGTCTVDVVDNPWWDVTAANDHWKMTSGSLSGVSATQGTWAKVASLLNLHGLGRLESFPSRPTVGSTGPGLTSSGVIEWEII